VVALYRHFDVNIPKVSSLRIPPRVASERDMV
jgi:hypothetical protein